MVWLRRRLKHEEVWKYQDRLEVLIRSLPYQASKCHLVGTPVASLESDFYLALPSINLAYQFDGFERCDAPENFMSIYTSGDVSFLEGIRAAKEIKSA